MLEYFIYFALKHSKQFSQVSQSVLFRWNRKDMGSAVNEIDVCAVDGVKAMFVSAKACHRVEREMVNEIFTYASQFDAIPVLVYAHSRTDCKSVENTVRNMDGMNLICAKDFYSEDIPKTNVKLTARLKMSAEEDEKLLAKRLLEIYKQN